MDLTGQKMRKFSQKDNHNNNRDIVVDNHYELGVNENIGLMKKNY